MLRTPQVADLIVHMLVGVRIQDSHAQVLKLSLQGTTRVGSDTDILSKHVPK